MTASLFAISQGRCWDRDSRARRLLGGESRKNACRWEGEWDKSEKEVPGRHARGAYSCRGTLGTSVKTHLRVISPVSLHITSHLPLVRTAPGQSCVDRGLPHTWIQRILVAGRWPQAKRCWLLEVWSSNAYRKRRPGRIKTGHQECLLHTWNSAQCYYYVPAWMRRGLRGEWIHVYVCLSPFAVHLQLPQHC